MRERLIELIVNADTYDSYECKLCTKDDDACDSCYAEKLTDYLLDNGVIVPPCKVGDKIFFIGHVSDSIPDFIYDDTVTKIGVTTRGIMSERGIDFSAFDKTVFLTREEAERALKGGEG